jgi:hypothetical protein
MRKPRLSTYRLVGARQVFIISLIVIVLTAGLVFLQGLGNHRSLLVNSVLTTTVLSVAFFSFVAIGLYRGVKLRHDFEIKWDARRFRFDYDAPSPSVDSLAEIEAPDLGGDDLGEVIIAIIGWILISIFTILLLWIVSNIFVAVVMVFVGMLYWIFFRALRLVFRHSAKSKGDLLTCIRIGITYTLLYNFWIYGIFFLTDYLRHN